MTSVRQDFKEMFLSRAGSSLLPQLRVLWGLRSLTVSQTLTGLKWMTGDGDLQLLKDFFFKQETYFRKILKDALKDAPFHHRKKPNKNLIHDDDQDVRSQLEKRQLQSLLISRRLSHNPDNEVNILYIKYIYYISYINQYIQQGSESSSINSSWLMNVANSMAFRRPSLASQRSLNLVSKGRVQKFLLNRLVE